MPTLDRRSASAAIVAGALLSAGATEASGMDTQASNKAVVRNLIQVVWREGRIDQLPTYWSADCVNHADPAPEKTGLVALKRYHETFAQGFADFDAVGIHVDQQIAEEDRVVTQTTMTATHKPTARPVNLASIRIDRLANGKIAEHWSVADMAGLAHQLA